MITQYLEQDLFKLGYVRTSTKLYKYFNRQKKTKVYLTDIDVGQCTAIVSLRDDFGRYIVNSRTCVTTHYYQKFITKLEVYVGSNKTKPKSINNLTPFSFDNPYLGYIIDQSIGEPAIGLAGLIRDCSVIGIVAVTDDLSVNEDAAAVPGADCWYLLACKSLRTPAVFHIIVKPDFSGFLPINYKKTKVYTGSCLTIGGVHEIMFDIASSLDQIIIKTTIEKYLESLNI